MAAKALSFSLFMTLKQGHCSRTIRAPPTASRPRYRLSATTHSHSTPGNTGNTRGGGIQFYGLRSTLWLMHSPTR